MFRLRGQNQNRESQESCPEVSGAAEARPRLIALLLALITLLAYWPAVHCNFLNYDDDEQVYEHPVVKNGLSLQGVIWVFTHSDDGHWIPLNKISHMLDCQFYGLKPGGHHLTNVLLHTASVILLFLVLRRMTGFLWRSAFVAAVFAIHPLRVESVAWVAERKDVLSGFFFLLTLWAYVSYVRRTQIRGHPSSVGQRSHGSRPLASVDYWLALMFFACGLMSKAMVATLPLLLLLLDGWPLHRFSRPEPVAAKDEGKTLSVFKGLILEKIPFLGLIVAAGMGLLLSRDRNNMVVAAALQAGKGFKAHAQYTPMVRTVHALQTPLVYLKQMFFPVGLVVLSPPQQDVSPWEVFIAVTLLTAISAVVLVRWRKQPCLATGWFWYLVMLAPILLLIQQGAEMRCDRYTYLPQIGIYVMLTWAVADWSARWRHRRLAQVVVTTTAVLVLASCFALTERQLRYWHDSESLFAHTLAVAPENNPLARINYGMALEQKGRPIEALAQYQEALRVAPDNAAAHYDYGNLLANLGQPEQALPELAKAVQLDHDNMLHRASLGAVFAETRPLPRSDE